MMKKKNKENVITKPKSNKKFLKRKKRYDPREAIRKEKCQKAKNRAKNNSKSAFPCGFFKQKKEENDSLSNHEQKSDVEEPAKN